MMLRWALALCLLAVPVHAQQYIQATNAPGAQLRGLDKMNGTTLDLDLRAGTSVTFGSLSITLNECRYPVGNPSGDAYASLLVADTQRGDQVFAGWMIASTPALSAMDHPRYDIWVMRCTT
jgi:hypothetical protein